MTATPLTPFQRHKAKWIDCTRCHLHEKRNKVVLLRGKIPCDVLFVGEAPGQGEDEIGIPFIGPAGHLFDKIIEKALSQQTRYALTNLVGCIPLEVSEEGGIEQASEPPQDAIEACRPRLIEIARIVKPSLVVCVGKLAGKHLLKDGPEFDDVAVIEVLHPAFILRSAEASHHLMMQRCIVAIRNAVEKLR